MAINELTSRQQEVLGFILQHQRDTGNMPTVLAINEHFGFRSYNAGYEFVKALRRKGYLAPKKAKKARMEFSKRIEP